MVNKICGLDITLEKCNFETPIIPETECMTELQHLKKQLNDLWSGEPWFGRPVLQLLAGISNEEAYYQPEGQHCIAELVWHMVNWREFTVSRVLQDGATTLQHFEAGDWRVVSPGSQNDWPGAEAALFRSQEVLLQALNAVTNQKLEEKVVERTYSFRELLHGIIQHDIYHLGQIAYVRKVWLAKQPGELPKQTGEPLLMANGNA